MKPTNGKRSDGMPAKASMQFFTPELYLQYNSADDDAASHADTLWEQALDNYHRHLQRRRSGFTVGLRRLAKLCLHDASLLTFVEYPAFAIIALQHAEQNVITHAQSRVLAMALRT
jgi:hypothetical protein